MDVRKFTMYTTMAAAGAAALALAPTALACDECLDDPNNGGSICWSGFDYGVQDCHLEAGDDGCNHCVTDGYCDEGQPRDCSIEYCTAWDDYLCWGYGACGES